MKILCILAVVIMPLFLSAGEFVWRVSDGDTIWTVDGAGVKRKIRFAKIDAPELNQPHGVESADWLAGMVLGKTVDVEQSGTDKYGRSLCTVWLNVDGVKIDVCLEMVKRGLAWQYSRFDKSSEYAAAQDEAKRLRLGLWKDDAPIPPATYRRMKKPPASDKEYRQREIKPPNLSKTVMQGMKIAVEGSRMRSESVQGV